MLAATAVVIVSVAFAQGTDSSSNIYRNTADRMMVNDSRLTIGGYGEVHYNQPLGGDTKSQGTLDVHRAPRCSGA